MEHVVFFPAPDGTPAFRRVAGLEDAVRLVEHLRNVEGVADVSVRPLGDEVPLAFRAYYRVEVPATDVAQAPAPLVPEQAAAEPLPPLHVESPAVEVPAVETPALEVAAAAVEAAVEPSVEEPVEEPVAEVAEEPVPVLVAEPSANGHHDKVKSLGFFAT